MRWWPYRFSLLTQLRLFPLCLRDSLVVSVATVSGIEHSGKAAVDPFKRHGASLRRRAWEHGGRTGFRAEIGYQIDMHGCGSNRGSAALRVIEYHQVVHSNKEATSGHYEKHDNRNEALSSSPREWMYESMAFRRYTHIYIYICYVLYMYVCVCLYIGLDVYIHIYIYAFIYIQYI